MFKNEWTLMCIFQFYNFEKKKCSILDYFNVCIMSYWQVVKWWNWCQIFIYFFDFCWIKKKDESLCKFCFEITKSFLNLEGAPKFNSQQKKKQEKTNLCPNDIIHTKKFKTVDFCPEIFRPFFKDFFYIFLGTSQY